MLAWAQVSADYTKVEISGAVTASDANEILLELMRQVCMSCAAQSCLAFGGKLLRTGTSSSQQESHFLGVPCHDSDCDGTLQVLGVRLAQLTLVRGESTRHKVLQVSSTSPHAIFDRLQRVLGGEKLRS